MFAPDRSLRSRCKCSVKCSAFTGRDDPNSAKTEDVLERALSITSTVILSSYFALSKGESIWEKVSENDQPIEFDKLKPFLQTQFQQVVGRPIRELQEEDFHSLKSCYPNHGLISHDEFKIFWRWFQVPSDVRVAFAVFDRLKMSSELFLVCINAHCEDVRHQMDEPC